MSISNAGEFRAEVRKHPEWFYIIHYSCQSLFDENEELSPRITSIAVSFYITRQVVSFSTHAIAEELGIAREEVPERYNDVERALLEKFYDFVRDRRDKYWVHWNMRNLTFGFEHIEHRARVLRIPNIPTIPVERRINLSDMLGLWYGSSYVDDPKMSKLMDLNGGIHREFLSGKDEFEAFRGQDYIKLHKSTLSKVGFFDKVISKWIKGKLKTNSKQFWAWVDRAFESRVVKIIAMFSMVVTIFSVLVSLVRGFL